MQVQRKSFLLNTIFAFLAFVFTLFAVYYIGDGSESIFSAMNILISSISFIIFSIVFLLLAQTVNSLYNTTLYKKIKNYDINSFLAIKNPIPYFDNNSKEEKAIADLLIEIQKSYERLKNYTSDVTHELKAPLTILRGELEMALIHSKEYDEFVEALGSALDETFRLNKLINSVHEISLAESGRLRLNKNKHNISEILDSIAEDVQILGSEKNINVTKNIEKNIYCNIDADRITQALLNLVDNAVKFTNSGGEISISLEKSADNIFIKIKDTGIGIQDELQDLVFQRFFKIHNEQNKNIKGSGLGLSIVHWVIKAHKGTIKLNSKINKGTEFVISLPED